MNAPAARVDDPITHSGALVGNQIGMGIGLGIGIVVGVLTAPATGPAAVAAVIVLANEGAQLGTSIGGSFGEWIAPAVAMGQISSGASTVFTGEEKKPQARIEDDVACNGGQAEAMAAASVAFVSGGLGIATVAIQEMTGNGHGAARIALGCRTISVERRAAARAGCKTTCGAVISDGDHTVLFGKDLGALPGYEGDISETPGLDTTLSGLDWVGTGAAVIGAVIVGAPGGIAAALVGAGFKVAEWVTGDKSWGYGDDANSTLDAAIKAARQAMKHKGTARKVIVFGRRFAYEMAAKDAAIGGTKAAKRTNQIWNEPEKVPTIEKTRP